MVSGLRDSAMEYVTRVTWEDNPQLRGHFIHFDPLLGIPGESGKNVWIER